MDKSYVLDAHENSPSIVIPSFNIDKNDEIVALLKNDLRKKVNF